MPVKAAPARSNWNGSYIGVHGGYGWADMDRNTEFGDFEYNGRPSGAFGGVQGGYNWVYAPRQLFGIEIDSSLADVSDHGTVRPIPGAGSDFPATARINTLGTARLRAGYIFDDTLLYVTGGAAYVHEKYLDGISSKLDADQFGWVVGAGFERMFMPDWSFKLEYDYADLGTLKTDSPSSTNVLGRTALTLNTVKVGLNYHGPVLERLFGGR